MLQEKGPNSESKLPTAKGGGMTAPPEAYTDDDDDDDDDAASVAPATNVTALKKSDTDSATATAPEISSKKRKRPPNNTSAAATVALPKTSRVGSVADSTEQPPDFLRWLPEEDPIRENDVLCGRGGESNHYVGNIRFRKIVSQRKPAYRAISDKERKKKTVVVRDIVKQIMDTGGRFVDLNTTDGRYYVVTDEKAWRKTSQALRENKELKWLEINLKKVKKVAGKKKEEVKCPFCGKLGHRTKVSKACLNHHEWLDASGKIEGKLGKGTDSKPGSGSVVGQTGDEKVPTMHVAQMAPLTHQLSPAVDPD